MIEQMRNFQRWMFRERGHERSSQDEARVKVFAVPGFIVIVLVGVTMTVWMGIRGDQFRRDHLLRQAQLAAAAVSPESVSPLTASLADTTSPAYQALCDQLRRIRLASPDIRYLYLLTERQGQVVFLAESEPEESADHSPPGMVYDEASDGLKEAVFSGRSFMEGPLADQYGVWVTAVAPVRAPKTGRVLAALGLDCDARNWKMARYRSWLAPLSMTLLAALLWGVLVLWLRAVKLSGHRMALSARRLQVSENRMKAALSGARQSLWDWDLRDDTLYVDLQWGVLLGYEPAEAPGHMAAWRGLIHPDDLAAMLDVFRSTLAASETLPFEAEYRVREKSGDWVWISEHGLVTERAVDGKPVRMTGTLQNITARRRAEKMLQERADALERSNRFLNEREGRIVELKDEMNRLLVDGGHPARYREGAGMDPIPAGGPAPVVDPVRNMSSVMEDLEASNHRLQAEIAEHRQTDGKLRELSQAVEQSPASVVITDLEGVILYVNPSFTEVSGFSAAEAMGRKPSILKSGKQSTEFYRLLWDTLRAGRTWRGDFENRRKDGSVFWEHAVLSPIFDSQGRMIRFLAVKQDITERRKTEEQMRRAAAEMEQMNRLMTGREERVLELKAEVNALGRALGREDAYRVAKSEEGLPGLPQPGGAVPALSGEPS